MVFQNKNGKDASNGALCDRGLTFAQPWHQHDQISAIGNRTTPNLPLQMALYVHVRFYPIWLITIIVGLDAKYYHLTEIYKVLSVTVFVLTCPSEVARLYLGYRGNLAGKIPELASFWLISAFVQLPLLTFLVVDSGTLLGSAETVVNVLALILLTYEIGTGTIALRNLSHDRAKMFYLSQVCASSKDTTNDR